MQQITVVGLNRARLLCALKDGDVRVGRVAILSPTETVIALQKKDLPKAVAILSAMCYNYSVKSRPIVQGLLKKLPLVIATVVCAALVFASNLLVWRVEVDGAEGALLVDVLTAAADSGAKAGTLKSTVDTEDVRAALRTLEGISAVTVSTEGNAVKIYVLTSSPTAPSDPSSSGLLSDYDAVVTRVIAESGTPLIGEGDVVKRGDLLISSDVFSTLDGSLIGQTEVRGSVYGRVTFGYSFPIMSVATLVPTGSTHVSTELSLFGLTIGGSAPPFMLYDSKTTTSRLFPLPITVKRTVFTELGEADAAGDAEQFMAEKATELNSIFGCDFEQSYTVVNVGGVAVAKAYFTAEIRIGEI